MLEISLGMGLGYVMGGISIGEFLLLWRSL